MEADTHRSYLKHSERLLCDSRRDPSSLLLALQFIFGFDPTADEPPRKVNFELL